MPDTQTPTDVLAEELFVAFKDANRYRPDYSEFEANLMQVFRGFETVIATRDIQIASLTATVAGLEALQSFIGTQVADLEVQIFSAECSAANAQIMADIALMIANGSVMSAAEPNAMAHAAIHSAADKRITSAEGLAMISRRDPLRQP
jgi:hypothetical protein